MWALTFRALGSAHMRVGAHASRTGGRGEGRGRAGLGDPQIVQRRRECHCWSGRRIGPERGACAGAVLARSASWAAAFVAPSFYGRMNTGSTWSNSQECGNKSCAVCLPGCAAMPEGAFGWTVLPGHKPLCLRVEVRKTRNRRARPALPPRNVCANNSSQPAAPTGEAADRQRHDGVWGGGTWTAIAHR